MSGKDKAEAVLMTKKKPSAVTEIVQKLKGFVLLGSKAPPTDEEEKRDEPKPRKPGGWKSMPYIIGNETFLGVATFGLTANFTVYLVNKYHMPQIDVVNFNNIFSGVSNFAPFVGAFVADAYWGKFKTLAYACIATFLGMVVMTLTAAVHGLQPPRCSAEQLQLGQCERATKAQFGVLILSLALLALGSAGVRPCTLPFGMDQFDRRTSDGRQGTISFFNWYYTTNTAGIMVALTFIVYLQNSVSWTLGFLVPTVLMLTAVVLFFLGTRVYIYVPPEGSVFSGVVQVLVAAYHKRSLKLPSPAEQELSLYNPPLEGSGLVIKLPLTQQYSFFNKAAIKLEGDLDSVDGSLAKPWRLCSVQRIEETKCLIRVIPIWASGITCFVAIGQQWTFAVLQAMTMDRHLGSGFQVPPGSFGVFSLLAIVVFLPIYDRILMPLLRKFTKAEGGITLLQRMGIGIVISAFSMLVAGLVEKKRRTVALSHGTFIAPISAMWLVPQLALVGISEAFNAVGQIEFYNQQFPEQMRSLGTSLFFCSQAGAGYLSSLVVILVQKNTGKNGKPNWLDNNINAGRVDYYYYILAIMGVVNLIYFLICSHFYHYKGVSDVEYKEEEQQEPHQQELQVKMS